MPLCWSFNIKMYNIKYCSEGASDCGPARASAKRKPEVAGEGCSARDRPRGAVGLEEAGKHQGSLRGSHLLGGRSRHSMSADPRVALL